MRARIRAAVLSRAPGAGRPDALDEAAAPRLPERPRLLVVRPDHLGDVLFAGPAIGLLRERWPEARIDLLVGPWALPVAARIPGVDAASALVFPWFDRRPKGGPWRPYVRLLRAVGTVRRLPGSPYDAALILRDDDYWGAWLAALAAIPVRAGHDEPGPRPFLTLALPRAARPDHLVAAGLALAGAFCGRPPESHAPERHPLRLVPTAEDRRRAAETLARATADTPWHWPVDRGPVAVHPGSGATIKRWRSGGWRQVLDAVAEESEPVLLTGGPEERELVAATAAALGRPAIDLAGATDLGTLAALYAACRLVLGPDSGPLHLAVAVGTPTVHVFGPADADRFGPWGPGARHAVVGAGLPCAPCGRLDWPRADEHPCVRVTPAGVVAAAARRVTAAENPCDGPSANL